MSASHLDKAFVDALPVGSRWEWPGGTSIDRGTILDRPFLALGKWWVAVDGYAPNQARLVRADQIRDHGTLLGEAV